MFRNTKTVEDWLIKYIQKSLRISAKEALDIYRYFCRWQGEYDVILRLCDNLRPSNSIPLVTYIFATINPYDGLSRGRAMYRLVSSYDLSESAPIILSLIKYPQVDKTFLTLPHGGPSLNVLDKFGKPIRIGESDATFLARSRSCEMLYLYMCGLASLHDRVVASNMQAWRHDIFVAADIFVARPPWDTCCRSDSFFAEEVQAIIDSILNGTITSYGMDK